MVVNPAREIGGDAGVERAVAPAGHDVAAGLSHRSDLPLTDRDGERKVPSQTAFDNEASPLLRAQRNNPAAAQRAAASRQTRRPNSETTRIRAGQSETARTCERQSPSEGLDCFPPG